MAINLKGKSFLTLMDLTPLEIRYLLDLGRDLKAKRRAGVCEPTLPRRGRTSPTWMPEAVRWARRRVWRTPPRYWAGSLTASSTGALTRKLWRSWRSIPACPCGTGSRTRTILPRSLRT